MNDSATITAEELFRQNERKDLVRLVTAGSVDDGKSTLIGRLLYDSKTLYEDHMTALKNDSAMQGSAGGEIDYALLLDGLKAEREQCITIDVAYRYFSTPRRNFIIADTPGHEQYTRNTVTGASNADVGLFLIDARNGVIRQTKRHSFIASLLGIKHIIVAVNKMDLVDYSREVFEQICADYEDFAERLDIPEIHFIPISALKGDNVVERSRHMKWFRGISLIEYLETVHVSGDRNLVDMRFPVQYVIRPDLNFRGYAGTVASGVIRTGDEVLALPSGRRTRVESITTFEGAIDEAFPPMSVAVSLEDEIDLSRGDMLAHVNNVPRSGNVLETMMVWMNEEPLHAGSVYRIKHLTRTLNAEVAAIRYRIDVNTLHSESADTLGLNDIGRVVLRLHAPVQHDPYDKNRSTGAFILIDRINNATLAGGMILDRNVSELTIDPALRRRRADTLVHPHRSLVDGEERRERTGQKPVTIWLTGLPGSGKSTVAFALERKLFDMELLPYVLDGENLRLDLSKDLSFTANDRAENVRRAAAVARISNEAGLIAIAALVSPYREGREEARESIGDDRFLEVFVNTPLEVCETRDEDGLYRRARSGELENFSGISAPYEKPPDPDIVLDTEQMSVEDCVLRIVHTLQQKGYVK